MFNSRQLALRDPARAALLGAIAGADFGAQPQVRARPMAFTPGDDYGFGEELDMAGFGDEHGFGAAARHHSAAAHQSNVKPHPAEVAKVWHEHHARKARAASRAVKLDPNMGSDVKVERYTMSLAQTFVLGTGGAFDTNMAQSPSTDFRPQLMTCNVPVPGLAYLQSLAMANVLVTVGTGSEDLYAYNANSWGRGLDMPTLTPANKAIAQGTFTTFVPPGYVNGASYILTLSFKGPSLLAGGGYIRG